MPPGKCRLCGETRELRNSHFIPAAFYKAARDSDPDHENPVVVTKNLVIQTSKQASALLLCAECEDLFNKNGERWTLAQSWQADGTFLLRQALQAGAPVYSNKGFLIYETAGLPDVNPQQLVYFGASIFWRASIEDWHLVETTPKLSLGPYEEGLRQFLLDRSEFPADAVIVLSVSPEDDVRAAALGVFPYLKNRSAGLDQYNFTMNGLTFDLFVGKALSPVHRGMCLLRAHGNPVFMAASMDSEVIQSFGKMLSTARAVGKLAR
jgi:hypothetical protein